MNRTDTEPLDVQGRAYLAATFVMMYAEAIQHGAAPYVPFDTVIAAALTTNAVSPEDAAALLAATLSILHAAWDVS